MNAIHHYYGFILAVVMLNLTPGADSIYILTRSIAQGKQAGLVSALGIASGLLLHICAVALGLAQVLAHLPQWFLLIQYLGAAYLVYLGIQLWRAPALDFSGSLKPKSKQLFALYQQGIMTNLLNPKVLLFFMAFLPQFVLSEQHSPLPFFILGITFLAISSVWFAILVFSADVVGKWMRNNPSFSKRLHQICGLVFMLLAIKLTIQ